MQSLLKHTLALLQEAHFPSVKAGLVMQLMFELNQAIQEAEKEE